MVKSVSEWVAQEGIRGISQRNNQEAKDNSGESSGEENGK